MEDKGNKFLDKKGKALLGVSLFVLLISGLGLYYFIFVPDLSWLKRNKETATTTEMNNQATSTEGITVCEGCKQRWLDGVMVPAEQASAFPVAIAIDNDILARPQAGLAQASLVYEAPVEGGMTRYLAIFPADADIKEVGPVRSARPYLVSWAEEIGALFIHCGGSNEALDKIKTEGVNDLNEFYNSSYFWRAGGVRTAPHNLLISSDNWRSYLDKRGLKESSAQAWQFKTEGEHATSSPDINIDFSLNFKSLWRYNAEANNYQRFFNGSESRDTQADIYAKNVIIHYLDSRVVDDAGRLRLDVVGEGQAKICLDGVCREGTWKKSGNNRTRYYYDEGEEIKLNPGITWIEVADNNTRVD